MPGSVRSASARRSSGVNDQCPAGRCRKSSASSGQFNVLSSASSSSDQARLVSLWDGNSAVAAECWDGCEAGCDEVPVDAEAATGSGAGSSVTSVEILSARSLRLPAPSAKASLASQSLSHVRVFSGCGKPAHARETPREDSFVALPDL